jgi:quercetin dioxygenase-like cupin family protein
LRAGEGVPHGTEARWLAGIHEGSAEYFTDDVRIDLLHVAPASARVTCASVVFEVARTAWHRHPLGQTLIVTSGCGSTQCEGAILLWRPCQVSASLC